MQINLPSSATLCAQCTPLLPLLIDISAASKDFKAHKEWWAATFGKVNLRLQGLLPDECELCRILNGAFSRLPGFDAGSTAIRLSNHRLSTYKKLEYDTCVFEACGLRLMLAPMRPVVTLDDGELVNAFAGRPVLQEFNPLLARIWTTLCQEQHDACKPMHSAKDFDFPFRVIDVLEGRVVDALPETRFVALSYVWGGIKQVMLKKGNKAFLETPGSITPEGLTDSTGEYASVKKELEEEERIIPRTIREAIQLCRLMGERYLWTDSLCILQDDEIQLDNGAWTNADKLAQIPRMDIIYGASALTIVAACGADSNAGLPGVYPSKTRTAQTLGKIGDQTFVSIQDNPMHAFWQSTWATRAWTFQEFLLSKRHIIFLPEQVIFHCSTHVWCEDQPLEYMDDLASKTSVYPSGTEVYKLGPLQLPDRSIWGDDIFFPGIFINQFYKEWLSNFVKRRLTVPADILFAFDGAMSSSAHFLGSFHHGLPADYFCETLNWSVGAASMAPLDTATVGLTRRRLGFPSWSWAGWMWDTSPTDDFRVYYGGKDRSHWTHVGIWGVRGVTEGQELWQVSQPDISGWQRLHDLHTFPSSSFEVNEDWNRETLPEYLTKVMALPFPGNCIVVKSILAPIYVAVAPPDAPRGSNPLRVYASSEHQEKPIGGISIAHEWLDEQLQILVVASHFNGRSTQFPEQTDEHDPQVHCLVVRYVDDVNGDGVFERVGTFAGKCSEVTPLEWKGVVAVVQ